MRGDRTLVVMLCGALACASGCAVSGPRQGGDAAEREEVGYFAARGRELARVFDLAIAFGPGLGARATLTRHLQAGALVIDPVGRSPRHLRSENVSVGVREGEVGSWSLRQIEYGLSPWYQSEALVRPLPSNENEERIDPSASRDAQLGAQIHLGLVGAEFAFDPLALVDFFAGLFGLGD